MFLFEMFLYNLAKLGKKIITNPLSLLPYLFIKKWFMMVNITAVIVVVLIFKNLQNTGVLTRIENFVTQKLDEVKSVAANCSTPVIYGHWSEAWKCLHNPPKYSPTKEEKKLEEQLREEKGD